ncbi:MAG TPA: DUF1254 domain-containing protein, partial [Gemmataceae bacterium]|nr:DUF1254 domain-containing protein [Gemmataceae bacterium]
MKANLNSRAALLLAPALLAAALLATARAQQPKRPPAEAAAQITVLVPADAEVYFDGDPTAQRGAERRFLTPPLSVGKQYHYSVRARWTKDGKKVEQTRKVAVRGGGRVRVDFLAAAPKEKATLSEEEAFQLGTEAYVYGYPLVTMEMTRRVMTNAAEPKDNHAPMGQFYNARTYPDAAFKDVTAPNADTLYSLAWLDVGKEPYVLSLPDEGDRYYLMPMLSGWTDVFQVPGKRTTGDKAQTYAITGPGWKGTLPEGVKELKSPTSMVWVLGRTYCTGTPEDYKAVHALQDKYKLVPLSAYGKPYTPPTGTVDQKIDMKTPVREQVNRMDAGAYFKLLAALMKDNPPAAADAPMVATLAKLGIEPGKDFDVRTLDPAVAAGLQKAPKAALEKVVAHMKEAGKVANGWVFPYPAGVYGTDYLQRATVAYFGLGANRTKDAVYPTSELAPDGKPYDGANKYEMTFPKGQMPPVNGFWSLTMYNGE